MNKERDSRAPDLLSGLSDYPADSAPAPTTIARREPVVLTVGLLVSSARIALERHLGLVWVSGEISNFSRAVSGHCYFNLKDAQAQVRCVFFRSKAQLTRFSLQDGLQVEVHATASMYEARGEFQLNVEAIRLAGAGLLYERFARLKARLEAAGWFAQARKRPLPAYPRAVGIVTSPAAAALRDVLTLFARRWPRLRVILYPCPVQGGGAAHEIARAIRVACRHAQVDVLIVCRGGGSIEDLWAFNEEAVAKAVFDSTIPVVSGVGHETDFTICDFVADIRAPTPTGAALLVAPDRDALRRAIAVQAARWQRAGARLLEARMQRVDHASRRLVHPAARLAQQAREASAIGQRMERALRHLLLDRLRRMLVLRQRFTLRLRSPLPQAARLDQARQGLQRATRAQQQELRTRLTALRQSLAHLNPQSVLERGYAIVTSVEGDVVSDAARLAPGDEVRLSLARGSADATIRNTGS
jgi:exodeoxyribonuclease VII large subunit